MSVTPESILVTGADGFVGRHLCSTLAERFPAARVVAMGGPRAAGSPTLSGAVHGDLLDERWLNSTVRLVRPDVVVHLAARSSVAEAGGSADLTRQVNVFGAVALGRAVAALNRACTFLFVSSAEVYGRSFNDGPADESTPLSPLNAYAHTKAEAERELGALLEGSSIRLIVCRPFNHTGAGQDERFVVPALAAQVARLERGVGRPVVRTGNLAVRRDFLDVRDVVSAYAGLVAKRDESPHHSLFNLASGNAVELTEIIEILGDHARLPFEVEQDAAKLRPSDVPIAVGDPRKIEAFLGWAPKYSFEQTVLSVLESYRRLL